MKGTEQDFLKIKHITSFVVVAVIIFNKGGKKEYFEHGQSARQKRSRENHCKEIVLWLMMVITNNH